MTDLFHTTPYDEAYPACERTLAELRIYPDLASPQSVTAHLGIEPTSLQTAGEALRNSLHRTRLTKLNGWFLSSEQHCRSRDIRHHLDWLLEKLLPARDALISLQQWPKVKMGIYCIWWSASGGGGPVLWPQQMRGMADLNLECGFDISFYGDDD